MEAVQNKESIPMRKKFKQFDVIATTDSNYNDFISNHAFASSPTSVYNQSHGISPGTATLIMQDWNMLQENLPNTIFVRTYENRIDLLTAVFIGPTGTPYHKGLFFYDIEIPSGYPGRFPKLCRRVYGLRLNPILNPEGICFKLFGPDSVCLLTLLLSIQQNLICSKPKLDHGVDQSNFVLPTFWGYWMEKEYLTFREDIFMLNCQTMLAVLRNPPKYFEEFVNRHFHDCAESILFTCKLYIDHIPSKVVDEHCIQIATEGERQRYKRNLKTLYVDLIKAFTKNGSKHSLENYIKDADINIGDTNDATAVIKRDDIGNQNKGIDKKNGGRVLWGLAIKTKKLIRRTVNRTFGAG